MSDETWIDRGRGRGAGGGDPAAPGGARGQDAGGRGAAGSGVCEPSPSSTTRSKRAAREREDYTRYANESLLRDILPVLDNFDRALQAAKAEPGAAAVTAGVELIQRELVRVLEKFGVTPFSSVGQPFDPDAPRGRGARAARPGQPEMTVVARDGARLHAERARPPARDGHRRDGRGGLPGQANGAAA